jgi:hypothetical protein
MKELHACVVCFAFRRVVRGHRLGIPEALRGEPFCLDAHGHQLCLHRTGAVFEIAAAAVAAFEVVPLLGMG